jgi:hypothetical protein
MGNPEAYLGDTLAKGGFMSEICVSGGGAIVSQVT